MVGPPLAEMVDDALAMAAVAAVAVPVVVGSVGAASTSSSGWWALKKGNGVWLR